MNFERRQLEELILTSEDGPRTENGNIHKPRELIDALPHLATDALLSELRDPCLWTIRNGRLVLGDGTRDVREETRGITPHGVAEIQAVLFADGYDRFRMGAWGAGVEGDWAEYDEVGMHQLAPGKWERARGANMVELEEIREQGGNQASSPVEKCWFVAADGKTVATELRSNMFSRLSNLFVIERDGTRRSTSSGAGGICSRRSHALLAERDIPTLREYETANRTGKFENPESRPSFSYSATLVRVGAHDLRQAWFSEGAVRRDECRWTRTFGGAISSGLLNVGARTVLRINLEKR